MDPPGCGRQLVGLSLVLTPWLLLGLAHPSYTKWVSLQILERLHFLIHLSNVLIPGAVLAWPYPCDHGSGTLWLLAEHTPSRHKLLPGQRPLPGCAAHHGGVFGAPTCPPLFLPSLASWKPSSPVVLAGWDLAWGSLVQPRSRNAHRGPRAGGQRARVTRQSRLLAPPPAPCATVRS